MDRTYVPDLLLHPDEQAHLFRGSRGGLADGAPQHGPRHAQHRLRHLAQSRRPASF